MNAWRFCFIIINLLFGAIALQAQNFKITYVGYENGNTNPDSKTVVFYSEETLILSNPEDKIQSFMDFKAGLNVDMMRYEGKLYQLTTSFDSLPKPNFLLETEKILGYSCKKASFSYFSNTIDVWYTENAKAKGSPYKNYWPTKDALVLKVVINGNYGVVAEQIKKSSEKLDLKMLHSDAIACTTADFEELKIKSRYTILPIFEEETINFEGDLEAPAGNLTGEKTYRFSKGTVILKKVELPKNVKEGAYVYAKLSCASQGDAYDRTGSVFVLPTNSAKKTFLDALLNGVEALPMLTDNLGNEYQGLVSTQQYQAPLEVMRFFTSFGADYFNKRRAITNYNWQDKATYKADITSVLPTDQDSIWVGVFIGNYSTEGHSVSLEFDVYPGFGASSEYSKWVEPLFLTVNLMEMSGQNYGRLFKNDTLEMTFTVPENCENLQFFFTSTGHGGWGGGDEFNPKQNTVLIDDEQVFSVIPWRTDCASYRLANPASGNFPNGMSSSDLSRSNWCPATVTPPYYVQLPKLSAGAHHLKIVIDQGEDEGGSFSHWGVSGILVGELPLK